MWGLPLILLNNGDVMVYCDVFRPLNHCDEYRQVMWCVIKDAFSQVVGYNQVCLVSRGCISSFG